MSAKANHHRISSIFVSLAEQIKARDSISIREIIDMLKERVFGMSILLFCIPNVLPIPNVTGLSAITGIPIGIIGLQMVAGRPHIWLPALLYDKHIPGRRLLPFLRGAVPYIQKIEVLLHPRVSVMSESYMQRLLGIAFIALATVMSLPIPFGNMLPGMAMALMAVGLIARDGLVILLGLVLGTGIIAFVFTVAGTLLSF